MITIRPTTDPILLGTLCEQVQDLHHRMYPELFKPYDRKGITAFFEALLVQDHVKAFVADRNGEIAGHILLLLHDKPESPFAYARKYMELDQILVLKAHRGHKVGEKLVAFAKEYAESLGITRIELNHWTANDGARAFFARSGFRYCKEVMFFEGAGKTE